MISPLSTSLHDDVISTEQRLFASWHLLANVSLSLHARPSYAIVFMTFLTQLRLFTCFAVSNTVPASHSRCVGTFNFYVDLYHVRLWAQTWTCVLWLVFGMLKNSRRGSYSLYHTITPNWVSSRSQVLSTIPELYEFPFSRRISNHRLFARESYEFLQAETSWTSRSFGHRGHWRKCHSTVHLSSLTIFPSRRAKDADQSVLPLYSLKINFYSRNTLLSPQSE